MGEGKKKYLFPLKNTTFIVLKVELENKSIQQLHGTMGLVLLLISPFKGFNLKEWNFSLPLPLFGSFNFELRAYKYNCKVTVFVMNLFDFLKL